MISAVIVFILGTFAAHAIANELQSKQVDARWLKRLYYYHMALSFVYYLYALFNASDSRNYFKKVVSDFRGETWFDFYGTSTTFIEFLAYPFIRFLGFSYEASMILFAFFGFLGFVYLFIFFKENLKFQHTFFGYNLLVILFLLPNLHFWSGSLGKGSVILMGFGFFFYGLSNIRERIIPLLVGAIVIYHVRPHIMLVILVSCFIGFVFSTKGVSASFRLLVVVAAGIAFFYIYQDVLTMVGIEQDELLTEGLNLSHRARELSKATSGIDISNYNLGFKLFTFIYRPLFFDAPGALGLIVSIENVFYLWITLRLLSWEGIRYLFTSGVLVKSAFLSFITVSLALAQVSGNLGIAIRQKSQVMLLFLFVIIMFMDDQKLKQFKLNRLRQWRRSRQASIPIVKNTTYA